jgi:hypothetical protein
MISLKISIEKITCFINLTVQIVARKWQNVKLCCNLLEAVYKQKGNFVSPEQQILDLRL